MAFQDRKYETESGLIIQIRQSDEEVAASGAAASGDLDARFHCYSSGSRRRFGIHARGLRLERTTGTGDDAKTRYSFLAFPTKSALDTAAANETISVGGITWTIGAVVPETLV